MTPEEQIKNILAFLSILFSESDVFHDHIMNFTPEYLMEKFQRYIVLERPSSGWGLHPSLRKKIFDRYCDKWELKKDEV